MSGIYCYKDTLNNNEIVYIGKDSNISQNKRHTDHKLPCNYDKQPINRIIQCTPSRYKYEILKSWDRFKHSEFLASILEIIYIKRYSPKFNFTSGGEDLKGFKMSDSTRRKISESKKGIKHSLETRKKMSESRKGEKSYWYGKQHSEETKKKISKNNRTGKGPANHFYGKKHTTETRKKMSDAKKKAKNSSGYYRVSKSKDPTCKQGFLWCYQYYDENGKPKSIRSIDINRLEKKVKTNGLEWLKYENTESEP